MTGTILTAATYQALWEQLGLADLPTVLHVDPSGFTEQERSAVLAAARVELAGAGPEAVELVSLLHRPSRSIDARLQLDGEVRALAAARCASAVLAVLRGDRVTLRPIAAGGLARAVVELLPVAAAGPGRSVSLPNTALQAAVGGSGADDAKAFEVALRAQGVSHDDAHDVTRMLDGVLRRGNFGVVVTDELGRAHRADHVVAWADNEHGRYLLEDSRATDGQVWTTVAPADNRRLTGQLDRLLATMTARHLV